MQRSDQMRTNLKAKTAPEQQKWVYSFGHDLCEGDASQKNLLGGKGANLAEMCRIGLPVPPGFVLSTEVCTHFYENENSYPAEIRAQADAGLTRIEKEIGMVFGDV